MKQIFIGLSLLITPFASFGACSGSIDGMSTTVAINISDGGCTYEKEHIIFWKVKPDGSPDGPEQHFPFDEECKIKKSGFTCHANGRTPLAGTNYKSEISGTDPCDETGKTPGHRLMCVKGCENSSAPKYLDGTPYEC